MSYRELYFRFLHLRLRTQKCAFFRANRVSACLVRNVASKRIDEPCLNSACSVQQTEFSKGRPHLQVGKRLLTRSSLDCETPIHRSQLQRSLAFRVSGK